MTTKTEHAPITLKDATAALSVYSQANSQLKKLNAEMELKITTIRDSYADKLDSYEVAKTGSEQILHTFALENESLFGEEKTLELTHGRFGFRLGKPAVKTAKGFTEELVLKMIKKHLAEDYVRTSEEINKELILANRNSDNMTAIFTKCGIEIRQEETFIISPKEEKVSK